MKNMIGINILFLLIGIFSTSCEKGSTEIVDSKKKNLKVLLKL
jgi:hypothetical protein